MINTFVQALPSIISASTMLVVGALAKRLTKNFKEQQADWIVIKESQRNQLKASIVKLYERAVQRGYITPYELESCKRMCESYYKLGGNSYIKSIETRLDSISVMEHIQNR